MEELIFAGQLFLTLLVAFILVAGFIQMGQYIRPSKKTKGMSLLKQYAYHCHMLGKVKRGKPDPWGKHYSPLDWGDIFAFSCLGLIWAFPPFLLVAAIIHLLGIFIFNPVGIYTVLMVITVVFAVSGILITVFWVGYFIYSLFLGWLQMVGGWGKFDKEEVDKTL